MNPLAASGPVLAWRLDQAKFAASWNDGEGAFRVGGRWNSPGVRAVYCCLDPSTAILEVAAHKGFRALDAVAHVLTAAAIARRKDVYAVEPAAVPDPIWLTPGIPSAGQQAFGDALLGKHRFIIVPSAVSRHSWNLIFVAGDAGAYRLHLQEPFALDTRLNPTRDPIWRPQAADSRPATKRRLKP